MSTCAIEQHHEILFGHLKKALGINDGSYLKPSQPREVRNISPEGVAGPRETGFQFK